MADIKDLAALNTAPRTGWQPGIEWDGKSGHVTTYPLSDGESLTDDTWDHVLEKFGLDPSKYMIDGAVKHSAWDVPGHGVQHSYRARIVERPERSFDTNELIERIHRGVDSFDSDAGGDGEWRTLQISDTHIGKGAIDGGDSAGISERWQKSVLAALGDKTYRGIHIAFLGDLIEAYVSQGGANISGSDLTLTEQLRIARHLVTWTIIEALNRAPEVIVSATAGNHGQTTRVQNVPHTDSFDLDIVSAVQQTFGLTGHAGRITWYYPDEGAAHVTHRVGDTIFTCAHGHLFKGKMAGAEKWWQGMTINGREPGAAHILLAGHFHSMQVANFTRDKWIMFGPSLENESRWFAEQTGATSLPGILSFTTAHGVPRNIGVF